MMAKNIGRRDFLNWSLLMSLGGLASCGRSSLNPILRANNKTLPKELLKVLPDPWRFEKLDFSSRQYPLEKSITQRTDLLAIGDGWLATLPIQKLNLISPVGLNMQFDQLTIDFLNGLGENLAKRIFPLGFSPWVMLFRNGETFLNQAKEGWEVLLESNLKGKVVLPKSPRLVMSIADHIDDPFSLKKLRSQVLTFDDRNGLNWLLSGKARVVVLPLQYCLGSLSRDHRLNMVLPKSGVPLNWTTFVRPISTSEPFPSNWIKRIWGLQMRPKMLSRGIIPPLRRMDLLDGIKHLPEQYQSTLLQSDDFWNNCWSFSTIDEIAKKELGLRWNQSAP